MMKDILCNTKWWGLYHIMIRSSRSQATRGKQNTASIALWHFEVAELQSKWEAEMGKPPVLEGLWGSYSRKLCSRVETLLLWLWTQLVWGKWEQAISRVNKKIWSTTMPFFKRACHGQKVWRTGVYYYYISPHTAITFHPNPQALLHKFFHEHWGKRALGRVPTSRSRPQKGGSRRQVFVAYWKGRNGIIGIVHSKCPFDKFRYFSLMGL